MTDWLNYWTTKPKTVNETEYHQQVDNTIKGQPYSDWQFQSIVAEIYKHLELKQDDVVLDLCCGNGLLTIELAKQCREVVGVDFSQTLLGIANRDHRLSNMNYQHLDVRYLSRLVPPISGPFTKVLMSGSLQFFKRVDLSRILLDILRFSSEKRIILFSSIPDRNRKWKFYNTSKRRLLHFWYKVMGRDTIGTWWDEDNIRETCKSLNLYCEFQKPGMEKPVSYYRFDVKIY